MMLEDCIYVSFLSFERVGSEFVVFAFVFVYQCCPYAAVTYGWIYCCGCFSNGRHLLEYPKTKVSNICSRLL
jgi:hypothetical protein